MKIMDFVRKPAFSLSTFLIGIAGTLVIVQNCSKKEEMITPPPGTPIVDGFVQIERLARPAVNEGLVLSNDNLGAFNSIPPTLDLATSNPAVLKVLQEASIVLDVLNLLGKQVTGTAAFFQGFDSQVVHGFLPDVIRIDTRVSIPANKWAYNFDATFIPYKHSNGSDAQAGILTGGRKIMDDVVDITLAYLVVGQGLCLGGTGTPQIPCTCGAGVACPAATSDNVSYAGTGGNTALQGHQPMAGYNAGTGAAQFPFLALPNV